jgi:drug/metabolite transporter (DMT)-like permease
MAAALLTPLFMGMTPVFGKLAMRGGLDAFTLSTLRTCLAALVLWIVYLVFFRRYIFIFPAGLLGTAAVGVVNGLGSLFYYNGLLLLDNASMAQILFMTYVVFTMLLTHAEGQRISAVSVVRGALALAAVWMLASGAGQSGHVHWLGVSLCLIGAALYALHVIISQRVMFEMPAPTMALYGLSFMGLTVFAVRLIVGSASPLAWTPTAPVSWWYVAGLMAVTALSRVTLFAGVRSLGGLQAVLLNVAEMGVTLLVAFVWLDERMTLVQWIGVALLVVSALLARWEPGEGVPVEDGPARRPVPRRLFGRWFSVRFGLRQITG